jgi:hypothetical protein
LNPNAAGGNGLFVMKLEQTLSLTAAHTQPSSLLLATEPTRRLQSALVDRALASLQDGTSAHWGKSFDDELLLDLALAL